MIRTHRAGKRALVAGLLVGAIGCGSAAAAAIPVFWMDLHARLAPVAGTAGAGGFTGTLLVSLGTDRPEPSANLPPTTRYSQLNWRLSLPPLRGPVSASLRLPAANGAAPVARTLCARCSRGASGKVRLTVAEGLRITRPGAVAVVRTPSAMLRGPIKVSPQIVASSRRASRR